MVPAGPLAMTTTQHDDHPTERVERVERYEQVRERPMTAAPAASNVNVGTGAPTSVWTATNVVTLIFTVLEVLLLLRFFFKLAGANSNQPLIAALYTATEPLVRPFQGILPVPADPDLTVLLGRVDPGVIGAEAGGPDHRARLRGAAVGESHFVPAGIHRTRREPEPVLGGGTVEIRVEIAAGAQRPREPADV